MPARRSRAQPRREPPLVELNGQQRNDVGRAAVRQREPPGEDFPWHQGDFKAAMAYLLCLPCRMELVSRS